MLGSVRLWLWLLQLSFSTVSCGWRSTSLVHHLELPSWLFQSCSSTVSLSSSLVGIPWDEHLASASFCEALTLMSTCSSCKKCRMPFNSSMKQSRLFGKCHVALSPLQTSLQWKQARMAALCTGLWPPKPAQGFLLPLEALQVRERSTGSKQWMSLSGGLLVSSELLEV